MDEIENRERKAKVATGMKQNGSIHNREDLGGESKANKQEISFCMYPCSVAAALGLWKLSGL